MVVYTAFSRAETVWAGTAGNVGKETPMDENWVKECGGSIMDVCLAEIGHNGTSADELLRS